MTANNPSDHQRYERSKEAYHNTHMHVQKKKEEEEEKLETRCHAVPKNTFLMQLPAAVCLRGVVFWHFAMFYGTAPARSNARVLNRPTMHCSCPCSTR